jgi:hypothetical protein
MIMTLKQLLIVIISIFPLSALQAQYPDCNAIRTDIPTLQNPNVTPMTQTTIIVYCSGFKQRQSVRLLYSTLLTTPKLNFIFNKPTAVFQL